MPSLISAAYQEVLRHDNSKAAIVRACLPVRSGCLRTLCRVCPSLVLSHCQRDHVIPRNTASLITVVTMSKTIPSRANAAIVWKIECLPCSLEPYYRLTAYPRDNEEANLRPFIGGGKFCAQAACARMLHPIRSGYPHRASRCAHPGWR